MFNIGLEYEYVFRKNISRNITWTQSEQCIAYPDDLIVLARNRTEIEGNVRQKKNGRQKSAIWHKYAKDKVYENKIQLTSECEEVVIHTKNV